MRCPKLSELPPPPPGKTGWPWSVETPQLPDAQPDGSPWPRISIVTPSYNQGQFIEETIRSVLLQGFPDLEYIIIDGGSMDGSVEIIRKYELWLAHWESEKDRGQSHAINKGLERSTGKILGWLNSDDMYLPETLSRVASTMLRRKANLVTGGVASYAAHNPGDIRIGRAADHGLRPTFASLALSPPHLHQSSTFWDADLWKLSGAYVDEKLCYAMDAELWFRFLKQKGVRTAAIDWPISVFRRHELQKTNTWGSYHRELAEVTARHVADIDLRLSLKILLWRVARHVVKHRTIHPRLGLGPPGDIAQLRRLLS